MPRLLFEKTCNAIWVSHLDLMRIFQRAFKRAGLALTHSQGFNPRPSVSIALPLSVGVESHCELLDFDLEGEVPSNDEILSRLNDALVEGVRGIRVYDDGAKIKHLSYLDCMVTLEYDHGICDDTAAKLRTLFFQPELMVEKKGKNGITEQNIGPMIRSMAVETMDSNTIALRARICCQNPTLNPAQLTAAIAKYLPECTPDISKSTRLEVYDSNETIFR